MFFFFSCVAVETGSVSCDQCVGSIAPIKLWKEEKTWLKSVSFKVGPDNSVDFNSGSNLQLTVIDPH